MARFYYVGPHAASAVPYDAIMTACRSQSKYEVHEGTSSVLLLPGLLLGQCLSATVDSYRSLSTDLFLRAPAVVEEITACAFPSKGTKIHISKPPRAPERVGGPGPEEAGGREEHLTGPP